MLRMPLSGAAQAFSPTVGVSIAFLARCAALVQLRSRHRLAILRPHGCAAIHEVLSGPKVH